MKLALTISAEVFKCSPAVAIDLGEYIGVGMITGYEQRYDSVRGSFFAFFIAENTNYTDFEYIAAASNGYGRLEMLDMDEGGVEIADGDGNPTGIKYNLPSSRDDDEDEGFRW